MPVPHTNARNAIERYEEIRSLKREHWFAWHPVRLVNGRWAWLRHLKRRKERTGVTVIYLCGSYPEEVWRYTDG